MRFLTESTLRLVGKDGAYFISLLREIAEARIDEEFCWRRALDVRLFLRVVTVLWLFVWEICLGLFDPLRPRSI